MNALCYVCIIFHYVYDVLSCFVGSVLYSTSITIPQGQYISSCCASTCKAPRCNSLWLSNAISRQIWVNIGSGNGLLPGGNKLLPKPMLIYHQQDPVTFIRGKFRQRYLNHISHKNIAWKLLILNFIQISQGQWVKWRWITLYATRDCWLYLYLLFWHIKTTYGRLYLITGF